MALDTETLFAKGAGLAGALVSLNFVKGTWPERIVMALSGAILSYFVAPYVSVRGGIDVGLSGFLVGLFGMAICSKLWEIIQSLQAAEIVQSLKTRFGL